MARKNQFLRITLAAASLLFLLMNSCATPPRPNVVIIVIDTLSTDRLPFHGYPKDTMPFLNSIAPRSTDFTKAYAGSSWTAPATASIFTSLYPFQHGVVMGLLAQKKSIRKDPTIRINRIPEKLRTLPEVFKANGYRTFGVSDNVNISKRQGFEQGFDRLQTYRSLGGKGINRKLLELEKEIKSSSRYFLYVHYNDAHRPYKLPMRDEERSGDRLTDMKLLYDRELAYIDGCIRELYHRFDWKRNTLLVVTADHGEEMMEKGVYGHGTSLYNTVIHVPLLFHYPDSKSVAHGKVAAEVSTLDILPTLNALLGFSAIADLSGKDLSPLLADHQAATAARTIYSHLQLKRPGKGDFVQKAAIANDCKYMFQSFHALSFYFDLKNDPREIHNLYASEPERARKLAASYFAFERSCKRYNPDYVGIKLDPKSIEHLKSLGYIQ